MGEGTGWGKKGSESTYCIFHGKKGEGSGGIGREGGEGGGSISEDGEGKKGIQDLATIFEPAGERGKETNILHVYISQEVFCLRRVEPAHRSCSDCARKIHHMHVVVGALLVWA